MGRRGDENARRFLHPPSRDGIHFFFLCFKVRNVRPLFLNFFRDKFFNFVSFITFCSPVFLQKLW